MSTLEGFKEYHGEKVYKLIEEYIGSLKKEEEDLSECLRELSIEEVVENKKPHELSELLNDLSRFIPSTNSCKKIEIDDIKGIIFHRGPPPGLHECSKCLEHKDNTHFTWYHQRVDKKGYRSRVNAHCSSCSEKVKKEKDETMKKDKDKIPEKPEPGSICPNCNRSWGTKENPRNWHKDHDAIKHEFRRWLCGHCNMSQSDHRNGIS